MKAVFPNRLYAAEVAELLRAAGAAPLEFRALPVLRDFYNFPDFQDLLDVLDYLDSQDIRDILDVLDYLDH